MVFVYLIVHAVPRSGAVYSRCAYSTGAPYFGNGADLSQPQMWTSGSGGSPSYSGSVLEDYETAEGEGANGVGGGGARAGGSGAGGGAEGALPAFSTRFGGAFASRPPPYGTAPLPPNYAHQDVWTLERGRPQLSAAASLSAKTNLATAAAVLSTRARRLPTASRWGDLASRAHASGAIIACAEHTRAGSPALGTVPSLSPDPTDPQSALTVPPPWKVSRGHWLALLAAAGRAVCIGPDKNRVAFPNEAVPFKRIKIALRLWPRMRHVPRPVTSRVPPPQDLESRSHVRHVTQLAATHIDLGAAVGRIAEIGGGYRGDEGPNSESAACISLLARLRPAPPPLWRLVSASPRSAL
ncbi:unnamed protein product, partial [Iphiclides podalirius]